LTSPGRPERTPSEKSERPDLEALKGRRHFAAIMAPFFTAIDTYMQLAERLRLHK
jgi:hypothetical protein